MNARKRKETIDEQMGRIAHDVAWKYAERVWWADVDDLEQQAWIVILDVKKNWAPTDRYGEIDRSRFEGWAYRAAFRQVSRYLWSESAPVGGGRDRDLEGLHRVELNSERVDPGADVERQYHLAELRDKIRKRIFELCGQTSFTEATVLVLLDGDRPKELAGERGLEVRHIYYSNEWVKMKIVGDKKIRELAAELAERRNR